MPGGGSGYGTWIYLLVLVVIMYFLVIRPQQKQKKTREQMLNSLKKNDRIVTIGGIHGRITSVKEDTVNIEVAPNVVISLEKSGISHVHVEATIETLKDEDKAETQDEEKAE